MNQSTNNLTATQAIAPYPNPPEYAQFYTNERLAQGSSFCLFFLFVFTHF